GGGDGRTGLAGSAPLPGGLHHGVEGRYQDEGQRGRADQPADDHHRERLRDEAAAAGEAERHRQQREDGRDRGHQDRPQPAPAASATLMPCSRYWLMRSINTIALVTTMPMSISMPMRAGTPSAVPVMSSAMIAPVPANGIETSRISGCTRLRNVAAMTRN